MFGRSKIVLKNLSAMCNRLLVSAALHLLFSQRPLSFKQGQHVAAFAMHTQCQLCSARRTCDDGADFFSVFFSTLHLLSECVPFYSIRDSATQTALPKSVTAYDFRQSKKKKKELPPGETSGKRKSLISGYLQSFLAVIFGQLALVLN